MPRVIIKGAIGPVAQPVEIDHDPVRGTVITQRFISAGDNCVGIAQVAAAGGHAYKLKRSSHISTCDVTWSGGTGSVGDVAYPNWQVLGNEIQASVWNSPFGLQAQAAFHEEFDPHADAQTATGNVVFDVAHGLTLLEAGKIDQASDWRASMVNAHGDPSEEIGYYDQMIKYFQTGQETFMQSMIVAKVTFSVSNYYGAAGFFGGEFLISTAELLSYGPPGAAAAAIASAAPYGTNSDDSTYSWSWRQLPAGVVTGAQNRNEISTEWWWGNWDTKLYPFS